MMIDISTLRAATGDFAESNKLGEGGFGAVYKVPIKQTYNIFEQISRRISRFAFIVLKFRAYIGSGSICRVRSLMASK